MSAPPLHRLSAAAGATHRLSEPRRVALIVVDMQTLFVEPGQPLQSPFAPGVIAPINRLVSAVRAKGGMVVWTRHTWSSRPGEANADWFDDFLGPRAGMMARLVPGSREHAIHPDLQVGPEDLIADKYRSSAFLPDSSGLPAR